MAKPYRPRRIRSGHPPPLQLTARDIEIIRLVAQYRFLNADHIRTLVSGSAKNITNRLKALFEHGFLDRPESQYDYYRPGGGSRPIVYALADKGARLLMEHGLFRQGRRVSWAQKNRKASKPFLEHTLAISSFAVLLHQAVRERAEVELLEGDALLDLLPPETANKDKPWQISVPVIHGSMRHIIGVEPDYAFSLVLPEVRRRAFFLVEIDRGTMPVERKSLKQTSLLRKLFAYQTLWKAKLHQQHFGWRNFRVLMVTSNSERIQHIQQVMAAYPLLHGSPLFLLAEKDALTPGNLLGDVWRDCEGVSVSLIPT